MTEEIKTPRTESCTHVTCEDINDLILSKQKLEHELVLVTQERDALRKKLEEAYERAAQVCEDLIENSLSKECNTWPECSPNAVDGASRCTWAIRALKTGGT